MTTSLDAVFGEQADSTANTPSTEAKETETLDTASPADKAQDRDEKGRFKGKEEGAEEPKAKAEEDKKEEPKESDNPEDPAKSEKTGKAPDGYVAHGAFHAAKMKAHEERQRREALERRLAELESRVGQPAVQQPAKPITPTTPEDRLAAFLSDPDAFIEAELQKRLQPIQQTLTTQQERQSEMWAVKDFGGQAVEEAKLAALDLQEQGGPAFELLVSRLKSSPHPFEELVKWHKEQSVLARTGGDLEAYIEAEIARRTAGQAPQQQPPAAQKPQNLPSSFASARSAGPRGGQGYGGPRPLSEILP